MLFYFCWDHFIPSRSRPKERDRMAGSVETVRIPEGSSEVTFFRSLVVLFFRPLADQSSDILAKMYKKLDNNIFSINISLFHKISQTALLYFAIYIIWSAILMRNGWGNIPLATLSPQSVSFIVIVIITVMILGKSRLICCSRVMKKKSESNNIIMLSSRVSSTNT